MCSLSQPTLKKKPFTTKPTIPLTSLISEIKTKLNHIERSLSEAGRARSQL
jgi:hypothetical protein